MRNHLGALYSIKLSGTRSPEFIVGKYLGSVLATIYPDLDRAHTVEGSPRVPTMHLDCNRRRRQGLIPTAGQGLHLPPPHTRVLSRMRTARAEALRVSLFFYQYTYLNDAFTTQESPVRE